MNESQIREQLALARSILESIEAALGGGVPIPSAGNSLTDPLTEDGIWRPKWLQDENAPIKAKYPDGWKVGDTLDSSGKPTSRTPLVLVGGFYFDRCLQRNDLTAEQRQTIQNRTQWAFGALGLMQIDEVTRLPRLPVYMHDYVHGVPGDFTLSVPANWYKSDAELRIALKRMYEIHLGHTAG
jgi:hypothetical protein